MMGYREDPGGSAVEFRQKAEKRKWEAGARAEKTSPVKTARVSGPARFLSLKLWNPYKNQLAILFNITGSIFQLRLEIIDCRGQPLRFLKFFADYPVFGTFLFVEFFTFCRNMLTF